MQNTVDINPQILTWAVKRSGRELQEMEIEFPRLQDWLSDKKKPTFKQLQDFANKVHVPFGFLFLNQPPVESIPIPYFKTEVKDIKNIGLNVIDTIKTMQRRQDWLVNYLKDTESEPLDFVGRFKGNTDVKAIVSDIRSELELPVNWAESHSNWLAAMRYLIDKFESKGIITVFNGVVDNNGHRNLPVEECRGFVLVDKMAPFIFVNNADFKAAQLFTLIHELAHIWIGETAGFDLTSLLPSEDAIEQLCDQVAMDFLLPMAHLKELWDDKKDINRIVKKVKVSEVIVAKQLLNAKIWKPRQFKSFYKETSKKYSFKKENQESRGNFWPTAKLRVSLLFASHVDKAVQSGNILHREAYKLTSLRGDTYDNFAKKYLR